MMKKINFIYAMVIFCGIFALTGCGKEDITENVTLKEAKVQIGTNMKVDDLFECKNETKIGIKNLTDIDFNKAGSYSIETTISKDDESVEKSYIVEVCDTEAPTIKLTKKNIEIYEKDKFKPEKYATVEDNSGEKITAEISENNVDVKTAGDYKVVYSAKDSSGNQGTAELLVKVKKDYTYKELVGVVKKVLNQKKYKKLEYSKDSTKKRVWIEIKKPISNKTKRKGMELYSFSPYWSYGKEKKIWQGGLVVSAWFATSKNYFTPSALYMKSSLGNIRTNSWSRDGSYDSSYVQCYDSDLSFFFDEKKSDKIAKIMQGEKFDFAMYQKITEKKYVYSYNKKMMKEMKLLGDVYTEMKQYL